MIFTIITHVVHTKHNGNYYAYEPYVREMNLWLKYVDKVIIVAPLKEKPITDIDTFYKSENIEFRNIKSFNITSWKNRFKALIVAPKILYTIFKACKDSGHIHLRCPGNIGLLGCFVQSLFPNKKKTAKYAGNWDPNAKQPWSYNLQKKLLSNTFFTRNMSVLAYGNWENQTKNIVPFFTASFSNNDIQEIEPKSLEGNIKLLFVGKFSAGKQPLLTVKAAHDLIEKGYNVSLDMFGDGPEMNNVLNYVQVNSLSTSIHMHGNQTKEVVKEAYKKAHFLIFISLSEGWPKVVAESMFFSCLPISTKVSCIPYMLDDGNRGSLIEESNAAEIVNEVLFYIQNPNSYQEKIQRAKEWSQTYTLEYFETELKKFLLHE